MRYADAQFWCIYSQVLRCHAEMVSGAYLDRQIGVGALTDPEHREMTGDEKRRHVMAEMRRHCTRLREHGEYIGTLPAGAGR